MKNDTCQSRFESTQNTQIDTIQHESIHRYHESLHMKPETFMIRLRHQ